MRVDAQREPSRLELDGALHTKSTGSSRSKDLAVFDTHTTTLTEETMNKVKLLSAAAILVTALSAPAFAQEKGGGAGGGGGGAAVSGTGGGGAAVSGAGG